MTELKTVINNRNCVLKFEAVWCGPCKAITPYIKELSKTLHVNVHVVDADEYPEICQKFNVTRLPTFIFLYEDSTKSIVGTDKDVLKREFLKLKSKGNQNLDQKLQVPTHDDAQVKR
tara:strand:- start:2756 stop:3106 length:351 start_codon:yes stop_codon:yes gene_type:complete